MIKRTLLLFFFLFLFSKVLFPQASKDSFILKGEISGIDSGIIYLSYYNSFTQSGKVDSTSISNGIFRFTDQLNQPAVAFISLNKGEAIGKNAIAIFLEPSDMNVILKYNHFKNVHLTGSKTQFDFEEIRQKEDQIIKNNPHLFDSNGYEHKYLNASLRQELAIVYDSLNKISYRYFDTQPQSYLTAYLLQSQARNLSEDSLALFYNRLPIGLKKHPVTQNIPSKLSSKKRGAVGIIAPGFMAIDTNNEEFYFFAGKGKYILLDFWASWCVPCRQNSKELINIYKKYKKNGLSIIGIADDRDTNKWKAAILKDKTNLWTQLLRQVDKELKFKSQKDEGDVNELFNVSVLPTYILIDNYGVIIGRFEADNDTLDKLTLMLETLFPQGK